VLALGHVGLGEFPVFFRVGEAFEEAAFLLVLGDMEEELEDERAVAGEVFFEVVDVLVAFFPEAFRRDWQARRGRAIRGGL
jgi:hypothetical protein